MPASEKGGEISYFHSIKIKEMKTETEEHGGENSLKKKTSFGALADDGAFWVLLTLDAFRKHCYISLISMLHIRFTLSFCLSFLS